MTLFASAAAVGLGAALGALGRHGLSFLGARCGLPGWAATMVANVLGSALIGLFVGLLAAGVAPPWLRPFGVVGLCGALTTFSSFSLDNALFLLRGERGLFAANVGLSLAAGLGVTALTLLAVAG